MRVLRTSMLAGVLLTAMVVAVGGEALPSWTDAWWCVLAGVSGAVAVGALYRGLAGGPAALVAPTAATVGVAVPVCVAAWTAGIPPPTRLAGLLCALPGLWLVSAGNGEQSASSRTGLVLAVIAGFGVGGFLVAMERAASAPLLGALFLARAAGLCAVFASSLGRGWPEGVFTWRWQAVAAGVLDAGGNALYILSTRSVRLDVAAVLASLYPVVTVALAIAAGIERPRLRQAAGMALCVLAVVLLTV